MVHCQHQHRRRHQHTRAAALLTTAPKHALFTPRATHNLLFSAPRSAPALHHHPLPTPSGKFFAPLMSEGNTKQPRLSKRRKAVCVCLGIFVGALLTGSLIGGGFMIGHLTKRANDNEREAIEVGSIHVTDEDIDGQGVQDILTDVATMLHEMDLPTQLTEGGNEKIFACWNASNESALHSAADCLTADEIELVFPDVSVVGSYHTSEFVLPPFRNGRRMSDYSGADIT